MGVGLASAVAASAAGFAAASSSAFPSAFGSASALATGFSGCLATFGRFDSRYAWSAIQLPQMSVTQAKNATKRRSTRTTTLHPRHPTRETNTTLAQRSVKTNDAKGYSPAIGHSCQVQRMCHAVV